MEPLCQVRAMGWSHRTWGHNGPPWDTSASNQPLLPTELPSQFPELEMIKWIYESTSKFLLARLTRTRASKFESLVTQREWLWHSLPNFGRRSAWLLMSTK